MKGPSQGLVVKTVVAHGVTMFRHFQEAGGGSKPVMCRRLKVRHGMAGAMERLRLVIGKQAFRPVVALHGEGELSARLRLSLGLTHAKLSIRIHPIPIGAPD